VHFQTSTANQLVVTWDQVGFFSSHAPPLNSFQLVLRGDNFDVPVGEGSIGFFHKTMGWEQTDTSQVAATGFGDGLGNGEVLQSSLVPGLNTILQDHHIWFDVNLNPVSSYPWCSRSHRRCRTAGTHLRERRSDPLAATSSAGCLIKVLLGTPP
jgi:hypothetical protein